MKLFCQAAVLFITTINAAATQPTIRASNLLGGTGPEIAFAINAQNAGAVYVAGSGGLFGQTNVSRFGPSPTSFLQVYSTNGVNHIYSAVFSGFIPRAVTTDPEGNVYLAGYTEDTGFPATNAFQSVQASVRDAVVLKLFLPTSRIVFATYLGGAGDDGALSLAVNPANGAIWISGLTTSTNFPTAGQPYQGASAGEVSGFLARLSGSGALEYSTYFGGAARTQIRGLALDQQGRPLVCGRTTSSALPTVNALQAAPGGASDAFFARFDPTGRTLNLCTYFGGGSSDGATSVALDQAGNIFLQGITLSSDFPTQNAAQPTLRGGEDIFVAKFNPDVTAVIYSTFLGSGESDAARGWPNDFGADGIAIDVGGMVVDQSGRAFIAGSTIGADFPVVDPIKPENIIYNSDAFATLLSPTGTVIFSTYLGGRAADQAYAVAVDPYGSFFVAGWTQPAVVPPHFPATPWAFQHAINTTGSDAFFMKMDTTSVVLPNDDFSRAANLTGIESTIIVQTGPATKEPGEPNHAQNAGGKSVWFAWTAPQNGRLILSTRDSSFSTLLGLYSGTAVNSLQTVASGDSEIRENVTAGVRYHIAVDGRDGASGTLNLSLTLSIPPNDDIANATLISGSTATVTGSNVGSSGEFGETAPHTVWWRWVAPTSGDYTLSTLGSSFDTWLYVYTVAESGNPIERGGSRNYTNNSRVTFRAQAGTEYHFLVFGVEGATGQIQLNLAPAIRPPNDDFANRIRLFGRNELVTGSDFDATTDPAERDLQALTDINYPSGRMVWWEWTSPIDGALEITTTNTYRLVSTNDHPPTSIIFFAGETFPTTRQTFIFADSPNGLTPASLFVPEVRAGTRYQIGLDAVEWVQPVQYVLQLRAIAPPRILAATAQLGSNQFSARVEAIEGRNYRVTSSTNLINWNSVSDHLNAPPEFTFQSPAPNAYRFYRVEELP